MSYSEDLLVDAPINLDGLTSFLERECEIVPGKPNRLGRPTWNCGEFYSYISNPSKLQSEIFVQHLGFAPTWRIENYFYSEPCHDPRLKLVQVLQLLIIEYECNVAWLGNCSRPQLVKREGQLTIQGDHSPYSDWADFLDRLAKEIGLPYDTKVMPSF